MKGLAKDLIVSPMLYERKVSKVKTRNVGISARLDENQMLHLKVL